MVDPVQITAQTTASSAGAPVDPTEALLAKVMAPQLQEIASNTLNVVNTAVNDVKANVDQVQSAVEAHGGALGILQETADAHSAQIAALEQKVGSAFVKAAVDNAKTIVLILVVGVVVGILAWWGAYLAGSQAAKDSWEAVPGAIVLLGGGLATYFKARPIGATP